MVNWYNQQNRHHSSLYEREWALSAEDGRMLWMDYNLKRNANWLNQMVSRLSKRSSDKKVRAKLKQIFHDNNMIDEMAQLFQNDNT